MKCVISPSQQSGNQFVGAGSGYTDSEQFWMEKVAKRAAEIVRSHGHIVLVPETGSYRGNVAAGNAFTGSGGLYCAVHSNAAGAANAGKARGTVAFYKSGSTNGKTFATKLYARVAPVSPTPDLGVRGTLSLGEVNRPTAKYVALIELCFHDNPLDAQHIRQHWAEYAQAVADGILDTVGRSASGFPRKGVTIANTPFLRYPYYGSAPVGTGSIAVGKEVLVIADGATAGYPYWWNVRRGTQGGYVPKKNVKLV